jgi:hypothetical protein
VAGAVGGAGSGSCAAVGDVMNADVHSNAVLLGGVPQANHKRRRVLRHGETERGLATGSDVVGSFWEKQDLVVDTLLALWLVSDPSVCGRVGMCKMGRRECKGKLRQTPSLLVAGPHSV